MRGEYHLSLSFVIGLGIFFPIISLGTDSILPTFMSLIFIVAIGLGSLVPDVDTSGHSKIFYKYPTAAKFFRYGIFKPLVYILKEEKHRGFMHSLEGAFLTVSLFVGYSLIPLLGVGIVLLVYPPIIESLLTSFGNVENMVIDIFYVIAFLVVIAFGLFVGIVLHLFEDTLTVSGIEWRWYGERKWYRNGNVRVGGIHETTVFGIFAIEGVGLMLLQLSNAGDVPLQIVLSLLGLGIIIITWFVSQTHSFGKVMTSFQGEDVKEIDAKTRSRAEENQMNVKLSNDLTIVTDKNRIKRGLQISKHNINLKTKTVDKYIITISNENEYSCSCKDFKNVGDVVACKHIIAFLAKKDKNFQSKFEKKL